MKDHAWTFIPLARAGAHQKTHLVHIFGKLAVQDRTEAVTVALDRGILRLDLRGR